MRASNAFVLDASVALAWGFEDETNPYTEAVLDALAEGEAFVPTIWPLEVGNALLVAERRGRLSQADTVQFLSLLQELPITIEPTRPERMFGEILALAREQRLSTYDASYLDLAMRLGIPLATQDEALRQAATRCGVSVHGAPKLSEGSTK
ncbi:MAG TPA: type II toxin-antitoxin system VapC family toxin [Caldilineae bacterium]|nr:type II toxin-antitoxin system VapC family toxin [Caldilineae bacterium]